MAGTKSRQRNAAGHLRRSVYLPDDTWAWLDHTAAQLGLNRTDLIREAIDELRAEYERDQS